MPRYVFIGILLLIAGCRSMPPRADRLPTRIAFGSCYKTDRPAPIWQALRHAKPDLFISMGDAVYADTVDPSQLRASYRQLSADHGYQQFAKSCPIMATWDDHDYGYDDAGAENPIKEESKSIFLDFFHEPSDSPRRQHLGVYHARMYEAQGRRLQVILLDTRTFRSPLQRSPIAGSNGPYVASTDATSTLLGEEQWSWLARELSKPADLRLIVSSIQVLANEHGWEKWNNLPHERDRLFRLLRGTVDGGIILLSGDRHHGELSAMNGILSYPLYDVTASGLNTIRPKTAEPNRHRIGDIVWENHFGFLKIRWHAHKVTVSIEIRTESGRTALSHVADFSLRSEEP